MEFLIINFQSPKGPLHLKLRLKKPDLIEFLE